MKASPISKKSSYIFLILLLLTFSILVFSHFIQPPLNKETDFEACTAVIVTGTAAKDGRAILMKNRDTSDTMNKPVYYPPKDGKYGYVMVNTYWMGINEKGLAVMNTQVSALAFGGSGLDNGALNRWIIENCETVYEVCQALNDTSSPIGPGKRVGGTCVGVIDRFGNGAFIEISGIGAYARFIVNGYDSQANHPRCYPGYASGPSGRDQYALDIMNAIYAEKGYISWEDVAQKVSRYVRNKEKGTSSFSISGEISNTITQAAMVAVSGDPRYNGKLNCMWGEYGNPPMVGLFVPSLPFAGQPPAILNSFWNYVWQKRSYAQDSYGYYVPSKVREIQGYTFFAEDYTFIKYDELVSTIPDNLSDRQLKMLLQGYVNDSVQAATQIYIVEPEVLNHQITYQGKQLQILTASNSTITQFQFSETPNMQISFSVDGAEGTSGFCYLKLPIELSYGPFQITLGQEHYTLSTATHNSYWSIINLTYTHPNQITISKKIFEDYFESGNFNAWSGITTTSGGYVEISSDIKFQGSYSAKFETDPITSGTIRACVYKTIAESATVYARAFFYIAEGLPLIDADDRFTIIQFLNGNGSIIGSLQIRRIQEENRFAIQAFGTLQTTTLIYPKVNTWFCIELFAQIHPTQGAVKTYINGVEHLAINNINTASLGNITTIRFGLASSINTQQKITVYGDCIAINTEYIGPRTRKVDLGGGFPPTFFEFDGILDGKDMALFLQCYRGIAPAEAMVLGDIGSGNPPVLFVFDGIVDSRDLSLLLMCYKGLIDG